MQLFNKKPIIKKEGSMETVERNISELKTAGYNANKMTKVELGDLKISMQRLGVLEPAVINVHPKRMNIIIGGHQRLEVAKALGKTMYPCYEVRFDEKKEREANLRLNRTGKLDMKLLNENFALNDLKDWGFGDLELMPKKEKTVSFKTKPKMVKCPECDHVFDSKEHKVEE